MLFLFQYQKLILGLMEIFFGILPGHHRMCILAASRSAPAFCFLRSISLTSYAFFRGQFLPNPEGKGSRQIVYLEVITILVKNHAEGWWLLAWPKPRFLSSAELGLYSPAIL